MTKAEQRKRIIALALDGMQRRDIADEVGVIRRRVYEVIADARRQGVPIPPAKVGPISGDVRPRVHVTPEVLARLRPHAERRQMHVRELAAAILAAVGTENLVDAVLDDNPEE